MGRFTNNVRRRGLRVETLERRSLLAADIALVGGVLNISGTDGNDRIDVQEVGGWDGSQLQVTIRNADSGQILLAKSIDKAIVQQVVIQGQAGNDTLVSQTSIPAVIEGGAGNDRIEVASKQSIVDGGAGTDSLGGIAALDALYAATSIETVNGKPISSWLPTVQDAGGTSRYGSNSASWEYNGSWGY